MAHFEQAKAGKLVPMKTLAFAATRQYVKNAAKMLKDGGYDVTMDKDTMKATMTENGETFVVAMALNMRGNWCLRAAPEVMSAA